MEMYNQWWDMWISLMPMLPNKWVFLNTSLQESIRRICIRDRFEEKNSISIEYQNNLYNKHIEFYDKLKDSGHNTIEVKSEIMDKNFMEDESVIDSIYNLIIENS